MNVNKRMPLWTTLSLAAIAVLSACSPALVNCWEGGTPREASATNANLPPGSNWNVQDMTIGVDAKGQLSVSPHNMGSKMIASGSGEQTVVQNGITTTVSIRPGSTPGTYTFVASAQCGPDSHSK